MNELTEAERVDVLDPLGSIICSRYHGEPTAEICDACATTHADSITDLTTAVARIKADATREAYDKGHAAGVTEGRASELAEARDDVLRGAPVGNETYTARQVADYLDTRIRRVARAALAGTSGARSFEPLPVDQRDDRQSPQGEAPCACQSAEVRELVGPCDTSPQGEGEPPSWRDREGFEIRRRCDGCVNAAFEAGTTVRPLRADYHDVGCPTPLGDPHDHRDDATAIGDSDEPE